MSINVQSELTESRKESRPVSRFAGMRVHFIGIGGCGMSGLARILLDSQAIVTGSEPKPNPQTFELTARGATISRDQLGELLSAKTELVVRSAAVLDWNPEYKAALRYGVRTIKYAELLGQVMAERYGIGVAGTHGKSTTTAMISHGLLQCDADPSFVVGGTSPQLGGGSRSGSGKSFVVEACEFDRSFHKLHPTVAIITNIEEDHLDCYSGIDEIIESFHDFARLVPSDGLILANGQDAHVAKALAKIAAPVARVGLIEVRQDPATSGFAWCARVMGIRNGCHHGEIYRDGQRVAMLKLSIPGRHNLFNATMAVAACAVAGVDPARAAAAVGQFTGVDRRMTEHGRCNGAVIVDDYGHHPTEIRATLQAIVEKYSPLRLFCVFQPHQHSRTRFLLDDFAASFAAGRRRPSCPTSILSATARPKTAHFSSGDLVERIIDHGKDARHIARLLSDIVTRLPSIEAARRRSGRHHGRGKCLGNWPADLVRGVRSNDHDLGPDRRQDSESCTLQSPPTRSKASRKSSQENVALRAVHLVQNRRTGANISFVRAAFKSSSRLASDARKISIPIHVLGLGANLLVSDAGVDGAVFRLDQDDFRRVKFDKNTLDVGAGVDMQKLLLRWPAAMGSAGIECLAGIPGTVGGAYPDECRRKVRRYRRGRRSRRCHGHHRNSPSSAPRMTWFSTIAARPISPRKFITVGALRAG